MVKLECTSCRCCFTIEEWNKANNGAVMLGLLEEPIPDLKTDSEWVEYRNEYGGRMDCPECGEGSSLDDIDAY